MEQTCVLTLAYDGTGYAGFARQPDQVTVQGELERALQVVLRCEVVTVCAGRTDAGVHALGQQVSFPVDGELLAERDLGKLQRSLNALTPDDIAVRGLRLERAGFSARFDAQAREYRYRIVDGPVPPVFLRGRAWWCRGQRLCEDSMAQAAETLVGEHDFASFCLASSAAGMRTVRRIESVELFRERQLGEDCLVVRVVGNAFLHNMVRIVVGTLVEVGAGRRDPEWVSEVLAAHDRRAAGPTAPAEGLTFWCVTY
jgi:tRNA pseudouridine38-40 synthase